MPSDILAKHAAFIVSLTIAANCLLSGSTPADPRVVENVVLDLIDCAGLLANQLVDASDA